jgi:hypothetical protein
MKGYIKGNIKRHSLRSFIHVIALTRAIAACFMIYYLLADEYGFDNNCDDLEIMMRMKA